MKFTSTEYMTDLWSFDALDLGRGSLLLLSVSVAVNRAHDTTPHAQLVNAHLRATAEGGAGLSSVTTMKVTLHVCASL